MTNHLPTYEGTTPDVLRLSFSGSDDSMGAAFPLDSPVTLIVHGKVTGSAFKTAASGAMKLVQSITIDHAQLAPATIAAEVQAEMKARADSESGQQSLDDEWDDFPGDDPAGGGEEGEGSADG